jgi:tetratricopeptide (TPR) repeat protein
MSRGRVVSVILALALFTLYGVRAAIGWVGGTARSEGKHLADSGRYEEALPLLERGTLGLESTETLWLRAQVRLALWQDLRADGEEPEDLVGLLEAAHREYTEAISMNPASGWHWAGLGRLYHQRERLERFRHGVSLSMLDLNPARWVGRPGRIAIGLTRIGIEREPTVYTFHDQLAFILLDYWLRESALQAVRESARVQPDYRFHAYDNLTPVPRDLLDAFAEASREALHKTPFLRDTLHLLALGRLEIRRKHFLQAERDLRAALEAPGDELNRAEGNYYLGIALAELGRDEEALEALVRAEEHPNFRSAAVAARGRVAERRGDLEEALRLLRHARRLSPTKLSHILDYARVARAAGEWKKAEEALTWGTLIHPQDARPWRALVLTYTAAGKRVDAERALAELERIEGSEASTNRLRALLESAPGP